jgi:hypothetical protein
MDIKIIATVVSITTAVGGGVVWAADQRYVTQKSLIMYDLQQLERDIRRLEIKVKLDEASKLDKALLDDLKAEKVEIERKLK